MTLGEMKKKTLSLIEELNANNAILTDDPDIATKINFVINQIQFELARIKKISRYIEMEVAKGDLVGFSDIAEANGNEVYQLGTIKGVDHEYKANGKMVKFLESGTAEIDFYVYPTVIDADTEDDFVFELDPDALEIMPYGVAADLLKSDISTEYGSIYATRYEQMLQRLDPRNHLNSIYIEGGW
jgi:hypothetical protein